MNLTRGKEMRDTGRGVKALIMRNGEILVLQTPKQVYDLPGGRVEKGETMEGALLREISEETGLTVKIKGKCIDWEFQKTSDLKIQGLTYFCDWLAGQIKLSKEHINFRWLRPSELPRLFSRNILIRILLCLLLYDPGVRICLSILATVISFSWNGYLM